MYVTDKGQRPEACGTFGFINQERQLIGMWRHIKEERNEECPIWMQQITYLFSF
jgi:hypothetical protein